MLRGEVFSMTSIPGASEPRALIATVVVPSPRGPAAAQAHDAAAAHATNGSGGAPVATHAATPAPAKKPEGSTEATPHEDTTSAGLLVSLAQLRRIMPTLQVTKATAYLPPLNQAMGEFQINVRLRKAAFLGQVAHESGELKWFHEFASGMEYDISQNPKLAKELGNINPGDGPRYKGRGPIQLTGRANYIACGKALGLDLVGHPDMAVEPGVAFRTAGWFWSTHGLNALADAGDYRTITRRINGGYTGYADRLMYYNRALAVFPAAAHA
jgi:putative chitinase